MTFNFLVGEIWKFDGFSILILIKKQNKTKINFKFLLYLNKTKVSFKAFKKILKIRINQKQKTNKQKNIKLH